MKGLYPGIKEAEEERSAWKKRLIEEPQMYGTVPNYERFEGWAIEDVLVWTNTD